MSPPLDNLKLTHVPHNLLECFIFYVNYEKEMFTYNNDKSRKCETLQQLLAASAISKSMAEKIGQCGSGLTLCHSV